VFVTAGGLTQRADLMSSGSFESSNDPRFHFGLGESTSVSRVEIRWPDGKIERVHLPAVDRIFSIAEGKESCPEFMTRHVLKHTDRCYWRLQMIWTRSARNGLSLSPSAFNCRNS